ncbi:betaine/proline/choline family ABC transporter ATP-binding protein [Litorivicinus lipolyticus]|jgi:glycine betaine/proline transport system ATP-binding protein|uniref:Quaternary amine transport ATP-binding protein n=1 Tax=Litorivicinus lipolyticus TaxID=418701 RepID=A0A5Q2QBE8_9GAMM|nr:betaine/proline/choline family ABC transporter ATP-binding protein [Litorivicinus lipolyticus]QGG80414.1 betaine/proline/choline family ABC transporter ATP-binding protein [Litorivicinus lipolyticus]
MSTKNVKVSVKNLYKIFGDQPEQMMKLVDQGMSKAELLETHGHVLGLNNINVDMNEGEITVIMGLSGSGKSTLIRHLNRLIEPTAGEVLLDGQDILKFDATDMQDLRRKRMSMVFQKFALFPHRTVSDNAALAMDVRGEPEAEQKAEAEKWLARLGLEGFGDSYPHQLSGGMQQRVGIARALCAHSDVMLLDEAFSALDPIIRSQMQDLLLELQRELHKTIIFITHDLDEALKLADHLVILNDGYVVQQGEPQSIILNPTDPYIEQFVADINRARVLRARSIMKVLPDQTRSDAISVDADANLESIIASVQGDTSKNFVVLDNQHPIGVFDMHDIMLAMVPQSAAP